MDTFVVFKKREGEKVNAYSLVNEGILGNIPKDQVLAVKTVEPRMYSTEELNTLRDKVLKENK